MRIAIKNIHTAFLLALFIGPVGKFCNLVSAQTTRPSAQKEIKVYDPLSPVNGNIGLRAATGTVSYTMVLPSALPTVNQVLAVNSINAGVASLSWRTSLAGLGTGQNGQVTYWNGTSSQTGSNDLFWDATNKRLGIGTSSPTSKLTINESTNADVDVSMIARGGDKLKSQLTFGVKNLNSSSIGGAIGSDGNLGGGLILNGTTNNIATGSPQVYINTSGELCVNSTTDNGNYKIQVNGDIYATNGRFTNVSSSGYYKQLNIAYDGTLTTSTSDQRLKKNIVTIPNALDKVLAMRGVTFNWRDSTMPKRMMGMIAQEVLQVVPELVFQNSNDGFYGINYGETAGLLVEAIKEQQKTIQELKSSIAKQNQEFIALQKEISLLKQQLKNKL
jgi:hypothetical protein